jgi:hypothetical protein
MINKSRFQGVVEFGWKRDKCVARIRPRTIYNQTLFQREIQSISVWMIHYAASLEIWGSILDKIIKFFSLPEPYSRTIVLEFTQSVREMSTRILPGGRGEGRPALKADNLVICVSIV